MKDVILSAVGAAIGLYALSLVEDNVLNSINKNLSCVAAPLAATAVMIFSSKQAADAKSIVGYVHTNQFFHSRSLINDVFACLSFFFVHDS